MLIYDYFVMTVAMLHMTDYDNANLSYGPHLRTVIHNSGLWFIVVGYGLYGLNSINSE